MNNIQKALDCVLAPLQDVEDALQQCLTQRSVDNATGVNLDVLGKLVGEPRGTYADDAEYRLAIRARVASNRSSGTINDLIRVATLIVNDEDATIKVTNHGKATQQLEVLGVAVDADLAALLLRFVKDTQAGGVRTAVATGSAAVAEWAHFDTTGDVFDTHKFVGVLD